MGNKQTAAHNMGVFEKGVGNAGKVLALGTFDKLPHGVQTGILNASRHIGHAVGEAVGGEVGVNPFDLGYKLGHDVIAPAIQGKHQS
jgi:hypothetical protein